MLDNIFALVAATTILILIPGPNAALIVATSLSNGLRLGLVTVLGTTIGIALQLVAVIGGLAAVIEMAASALSWIKWMGVAYLVYLGVRSWFQTPDDLSQIKSQSGAHVFWRGVLLATVNPKTLLFNAAFLPQFLTSVENVGFQLCLITGVFLLVILVGDSLWALFAASARDWLIRVGKIRNRMTSGFLFGAGLALALSRRNA
jgi:threonine/homoserine/homoserine lactone efflux protein